MAERITKAMVEAACAAHWGSWPGDRSEARLSSARRDMRAALTAALSQEPGVADGWRSMDSAPKDQEVLIAYWRWRNSMSPGSIVVQSASLTEHHGKGIWSWVVSDNRHGPFPIRGWCDGDLLGWMPLPAAPLSSEEKR